MIDIRKLKELVRLMVSNELTELDLRDSEEQVTLRRNSPHQSPQVIAPPIQSSAALGAAASGATAVAEPPARSSSADQEDDGLVRVESPMVGTFYSAPDPDATPFVTAGSSVGPDDTVCMIEAMKIFNEIKAECSGTVRKVLVKNGEAVEFGQPLFLVEPA